MKSLADVSKKIAQPTKFEDVVDKVASDIRHKVHNLFLSLPLFLCLIFLSHAHSYFIYKIVFLLFYCIVIFVKVEETELKLKVGTDVADELNKLASAARAGKRQVCTNPTKKFGFQSRNGS
jgi:Ca2+/Na+ antiporter